ncbi:urate hydroxylase PuuD [Phenylobacterium sp. J367]|uniref:urate hydroxylase PuuD n=1 Tax=Phenylobacterium sp. J367 TaxID=2898435 RepID=UPI002150B2AD|nr:urate hydroxylase PuuD [Phenylobacterium sp. J367]MCR5879468.1 urate hydroxylase PuuD [Phenylobacterium sp. J367]
MDWAAWANLGIRWLHLIAGIAWIGSSFYFMWLDSHLKPPAEKRDGVSGELWAVHSGGFYHKRKFMVAPPEMPEELHWFKWEAYTTWISGALLLSLIYYLGAGLNLVDASKVALEPWQAVLIGVGFLAGGWIVYDLMCRSKLGQNLRLFGVVWFLTLTAATWALTRIFADLGAFMHVGGMMGTIMAANVFLVIIPNQKKMVAQMLAGETPDASLGKKSKQRSVHNNYMTLPVLLIMISNHYPMLFASHLNWLWLAALGLVGWAIRHYFNLKNAGRHHPEVLVGGLLAFVVVGIVHDGTKPKVKLAETVPPYPVVRQIVDKHCIACHAAAPTHRGYPAAPNGVMLDTGEALSKHAGKVFVRAVETTSMPLGNETGMTPAERQQLGAWIKAGAKAE